MPASAAAVSPHATSRSRTSRRARRYVRIPMPAPTRPTNSRMPNPPMLRYSKAYVTSASHDCATHLVPGAVYENTSWCGMPWSRMYSPVRRCQKNELSVSFARPVAQPNTPKNAVNTHPRPEPDAGTGVVGAAASGGAGATGRVRVGVAVTSERSGDVDHRRSEDDHEDRGEDAEHEGEQHLDRRLLRLLLGHEATLDAHLVGLRSQEPGDGHTEGVGLQHGEDEAPQLGHVTAVRHGAQRVGPGRTDADLVQHPAELVGERAGHRGAGAVERLLEAEAGLDRDDE